MLIKLKGDRHAESNNHEESREEDHHEEDRGKEEHCEKNYEEKQVKDLLLTCRRYPSPMQVREKIAAELSSINKKTTHEQAISKFLMQKLFFLPK